MKYLQEIKNDDLVYAIILRSDFKEDGIKFFTPSEFSQQLGYMNRAKGYVIEPHIHKPVSRQVHFTKVLFIKKGLVQVDFYKENKEFLCSEKLYSGDVILLVYGGHGFEMLEDSEVIEVKQGPYAGDLDKERFIPDR